MPRSRERMKYYEYEGMPAYGLDGDFPTLIRSDGSELRLYDLEAFGREAVMLTKAGFEKLKATGKSVFNTSPDDGPSGDHGS